MYIINIIKCIQLYVLSIYDIYILDFYGHFDGKKLRIIPSIYRIIPRSIYFVVEIAVPSRSLMLKNHRNKPMFGEKWNHSNFSSGRW